PEPDGRRRLLAAVRVALQLPRDGDHLPRAARAGGPPDRVPDARPRRDPLVLGAGVAYQEGQRPRNHDPCVHHADEDGELHPGLHGALRVRPLDDEGAGGGRALAGGMAAVGLRTASYEVDREAGGDHPGSDQALTTMVEIISPMEGWRE